MQTPTVQCIEYCKYENPDQENSVIFSLVLKLILP